MTHAREPLVVRGSGIPLVMGLPDPHEKPTLSVDEVVEILGWGRSAIYQDVR